MKNYQTKKKLLDNFKIIEDCKLKRIENHILNKVSKEIEYRLEFNKIVSDAYTRFKNKK